MRRPAEDTIAQRTISAPSRRNPQEREKKLSKIRGLPAKNSASLLQLQLQLQARKRRCRYCAAAALQAEVRVRLHNGGGCHGALRLVPRLVPTL